MIIAVVILTITLQLLKGVTISQGGVLPHIPEVLLYKRSQWGKLKSASLSQSSPAVTIPASPKPKAKKPAAATPKKAPAKKTPPKKSSASKRKSIPKKKKAVEVCFILLALCFYMPIISTVIIYDHKSTGFIAMNANVYKCCELWWALIRVLLIG